MLKKFLSRKFLVTLGALIVATFGVLNPGSEDVVQGVVDKLIDVLFLVVPATVYVVVEGQLDKKGMDKE